MVEPLIPPAKRGGNKRHVNLREVVNGLMYILSTGCQWRALPKDLPPRSTVYDYFDLWSWTAHSIAFITRSMSGVAKRWIASKPDRRNHRHSERKKRRKRGASIDPSGYDAGKKVKGKKRHILSIHTAC